MSGKVADLLGILFFVLTIGLVFQQIATSMTEQGIASGGPYDNAASYPRSLAILLGTLLIGYIATLLVARGRSATGPHGSENASSTPERRSEDRHESAAATKGASDRRDDESERRGVALLIVFAVYLWSLPVIGYHLATPLMLGCLLMLAGSRQVIGMLAFSVAMSIGISFVFEVFLNVVLPGGRFGLNIAWPSF